jgi:hypothetical protein
MPMIMVLQAVPPFFASFQTLEPESVDEALKLILRQRLIYRTALHTLEA